MKKILLLLSFSLSTLSVFAQLSNSQIIKIKDDADDGKTLWTKFFEEAYNKKDMSSLPPLRKANEDFLNEHISKLSRLYSEGDGRELIIAVKNYLVVEKQFVKDVMLPAESLKPGDDETYNQLNRKIADFIQKERAFEIDITNAIRSSPEPMNLDAPEETDQPDEEMSEEEIKKREEAKPRRKEKLPHEKYDKKKKRRNQNDDDDE